MNFTSPLPETTECDREAIHNIAAVQQFGGLIVLNSEGAITNRSTNCAAVLGVDTLPDPGTDLSALFSPAAIKALRTAQSKLKAPDDIHRLFRVQLIDGGGHFDCAVHASRFATIIEFEPHDENKFIDHISLIGPMIAQLEPIKETRELCATTAVLARRMLGYDRVMVYKFHSDDSGEVVAEDAREDLEPYLGLRYPSTDIPQQARELFRRNRVRMIADVAGEGAPIEPAQACDNQPLDLSMSVLREHSRVHNQYLTNMGVGATLSIAIVQRDRLWGMISCHHMTPHHPSFSLRTVAESLGHVFSLILDRILIYRSEQVRSRERHLHKRLMANLANGASLASNVALVAEEMDDLIAHSGLTVQVGADNISYGDAPNERQLKAIAPELADAKLTAVYGTTRLADHIGAAASFDDHATGALIVPISSEPGDYLIFWRKPLAKTIRWAGDPTKAKVLGPDDRLHPRDSFAAWEQSVLGHSADWSDDDLNIAEGLRVTLLELMLRKSEEVSQEQQGLLILELNHRVRNILNLIRGLVSQTKHDALNVESFASIIGGRIAALAIAHENITLENWAPAPISRLFDSEIEAYLNGNQDRFILEGEPVLIKPEAYTVLALVVHEMMTNSAKYGGLCERFGQVCVALSRTPDGDLKIAWRERGGPPVQPPQQRGFGSTIIERSIPFELKGKAELRFKLTGLEADFVIPGRYVTTTSTAHPVEETSSNDNAMPAMARTVENPGLPSTVLVVEDSMIIALDTEENLRRLGVDNVAVTSCVSEALKAIETQQLDFAIVDFNLGSESSQPVMERLRDTGVPFVLATGYAELGHSVEELGAVSVIRKPYGRTEIAQALKDCANGKKSGPSNQASDPGNQIRSNR